MEDREGKSSGGTAEGACRAVGETGGTGCASELDAGERGGDAVGGPASVVRDDGEHGLPRREEKGAGRALVELHIR